MTVNSTDPPLRIAHVLGKMHGGGVEAMVMNYYRHINKSKIQFDFFVDKDSSIVPYQEIESLGGRVFEIAPYQNVIQYRKELTTIFLENNYKVVHSHINSLSPFPLSAAKKAGIPIRIAHSHSTSAPGETTKNIVKNTLRPFSKVYPSHYFSCTNTAGEWLFGKNIVKTKQLQVINNAIDVNKFAFNKDDRESLRVSLGLVDKLVIGHTGRLCFQKNQAFLIRVLHSFLKYEPDTILLLVGDGQDLNKLTNLAERLGIRESVLFLGNRADVHRYYSAMDVFAFPSKYEGFGISAIEAQASGLPVILSETVPKEACLSDQCAVLPLKEGEDNWTKKILELKEKRDRQLNGDFTDYSIDIIADNLESLYLSLVTESERG